MEEDHLFVSTEDGRQVVDLDALDRRGRELFDRREYEGAVRLCESVLLMPNLEVYLRDLFTNNYCLCLHGICFSTGVRVDEYFRISYGLLDRLNQSDCRLTNIESHKCQLHQNRASLLYRLYRYEECISEATKAIQIDPMNKYSIRTRSMRCFAYGKLSRFDEMKSDLDELRRLQKLGLAKGQERNIEVLSAYYNSSLEMGSEAERKRYDELFARGLASIQSVSTAYDPTQSIDWNVNQLLYYLKSELELEYSCDINTTGKINKHLVPRVCFCRRIADALVHMALAATDEQQVLSRFLSTESSRVSVLRISDTMKNPLVLSHKQRQRIMLGEQLSLLILDQTEDFWPSEGFIIAYHMILECELCSPSLVRWIVSNGTCIHADRQEIDSSELISDIDFLPLLFAGGKPSMGDPRWSQQADVCHQLYALLLGGLEPYFSPVKRLIFVPDIHLFRVSFNALLSPDGHYLIENHTVSVSSSIRLIRENQEQKMRLLLSEPSRVGALVCGDVVKSSGEGESATEVDGIVRCLASLRPDCELGAVIALRKNQFCPSHLEEFCRILRPRFVHIVAHGCAIDVDVDENSDVLENFRIHGEMDSSNGTVISAREIAWNYDLSGTDLVFLNSCSVGYGKLQKSGVLGFNNAIFQAGCPSVISSLWQVQPDLSNELTKFFYRLYLSGTFDKAESLRYAILELLRRHPFVALDGRTLRLSECPALWGSYQLFGNPL